MPRLVLAPRALEDLDRVADFLLTQSPTLAADPGSLIVEALQVLKGHPLIGRPVEEGLRELVISRGRTGYVALYRYQIESDRVLVLGIRHQRELANPDSDATSASPRR